MSTWDKWAAFEFFDPNDLTAFQKQLFLDYFLSQGTQLTPKGIPFGGQALDIAMKLISSPSKEPTEDEAGRRGTIQSWYKAIKESATPATIVKLITGSDPFERTFAGPGGTVTGVHEPGPAFAHEKEFPLGDPRLGGRYGAREGGGDIWQDLISNLWSSSFEDVFRFGKQTGFPRMSYSPTGEKQWNFGAPEIPPWGQISPEMQQISPQIGQMAYEHPTAFVSDYPPKVKQGIMQDVAKEREATRQKGFGFPALPTALLGQLFGTTNPLTQFADIGLKAYLPALYGLMQPMMGEQAAGMETLQAGIKGGSIPKPIAKMGSMSFPGAASQAFGYMSSPNMAPLMGLSLGSNWFSALKDWELGKQGHGDYDYGFDMGDLFELLGSMGFTW